MHWLGRCGRRGADLAYQPFLRGLAAGQGKTVEQAGLLGCQQSAEPHIRQLAGDRMARGVALCWLADHGLLAERELYDPGDLETFCDVLASRSSRSSEPNHLRV